MPPSRADTPHQPLAPTTLAKGDQLRILQVVAAMNHGGVETWLMHLLRRIDHARFRMDFLVHTAQPGSFDSQIRDLGSHVIPCLQHSNPWRYPQNFKRVLHQYGPFDIVHCHMQHFSGFVLRQAHRCGIGTRIAHSHLDTSALEAQASLRRRVYLRLSERWIRQFATVRLACSRDAATSLFGPAWASTPGVALLYCGVDTQAFLRAPDRAAVRRELSIPYDAFVLGHVGRLAEQKNHAFLLDVAAEVAQRQADVVLLLVGDGPLRPALQARAARLGISNRVIFAGSREDVPRLMMGAMDIFVLPSLFEGLPLAAVEAQAAGLPCVVADTISKEADLVPPLITRLSLSVSKAAWADVIVAHRHAAPRIPQSEALALVERSPCTIQSSMKRLETVYCESARRQVRGASDLPGNRK